MPRVRLDALDTELELVTGSSLIDLESEYFGMRTIPFGCRKGVCGACLVEVREGASSLGIQATDEAAFIRRLGYDPENHRLACRCTLNGDVSLRPVASTTTKRPRRAEQENCSPTSDLCRHALRRKPC